MSELVTADAATLGCDWGGTKVEKGGYLSLKALDPRNGKEWEVLFRKSRLSQMEGRPEAIRELQYTLPQVLQAPTAIYVGIRDDPTLDDNCGLCYVGRPDRIYVAPRGEFRPMSPKRVYMLFVNADRIIYNWRREASDDSIPDLPMKKGQDRFGALVYYRGEDDG